MDQDNTTARVDSEDRPQDTITRIIEEFRDLQKERDYWMDLFQRAVNRDIEISALEQIGKEKRVFNKGLRNSVPVDKRFSVSKHGRKIRDEFGRDVPWDDLIGIQEALTRTMACGQPEADRMAMLDLAEYYARRGKDENYPPIKDYLKMYPSPKEDVFQVKGLIHHYQTNFVGGEQ